MRFLIAGSSGFLGTALREHLADEGHEVVRLVRGDASGPGTSPWDPYAGELDQAEVERADVVVNLAGRPLVGNPHSAAYRRDLMDSRVKTTSVLAEAIARSERKPVFLAQNGTAYYGDRGDEVLDEDSGTAEGSILTPVTRAWEAATQPAVDAGARVCVLRTGPVLHRSGGALKPILLLFKAGLGGRLGSGRQYFPISSLEDWVRATMFLATNDASSGPYNMVAPQPPTNTEFTKALGRALGRPTVLPVPAFAIRLAAGPVAPELLGSYRIVPARLQAEGFTFHHPGVDAILRSALQE
ncbi:MAG: TIGR01777 family oxidoreductase [Nocardioides sp.]|nr:TIGR01777 family oxidoreductase [Nocardioides sp.]